MCRAAQKATLWVSRRIGAFDVGGEFMAVDKRFNSNTETGLMDAYTLTNLTGRYAITKELAIEGRINNVFDTQYETALGYGTFGRNAFIGLRYSPK